MNTIDLYTGDGSTKTFTFSFPYISPSHVIVAVNGLDLLSLDYKVSGNQVTLNTAPENGASIKITRKTSPDSTLVDFHNGSLLSEDELDTAYLHNFYLSQEYADSFNKMINDALLAVADGTGIVETGTDEVLAALVNEMLNQEAADTLQQRVNDIDTNAESIVSLGESLQVQVNTIAQGVAAVVYVQDEEPIPGEDGIPDPITDGARWYDSDDNNKPYIYDATSVEWVSIEDPRIGQAVTDISILQTDVDDNAAAIVTEQTARSDADSAIASELALLGAQNGAQTAFILDTSTVKIDSDSGDTFASKFSSLATADSDNSAAIQAEETARIDGDSANASSISTLDSRLTTAEGDIDSASITISANTSAINDAETDITSLYARYGVTLDVNGYVTGFAQNNDGETGSFVIVADKFGIANPGDPSVFPFLLDGDTVKMQNVIIDNAVISDLSVGKLTNGNLDADIDVGTGRIVWDNGAFMKVTGVGFGSSNQFLEWFGPTQANFNDCTEANAKYYLKTNGEAFFSGTLSVGDISNSGQTTDTAADAEIVVGPFGSNGNNITVNFSFTHLTDGQKEGDQTGQSVNDCTATLELQRKVGTGSYSVVQTKNVTGTYSAQYFSPSDRTAWSQNMSGSWTYTDTLGSTSDRTYRWRLTARSVPEPTGTDVVGEEPSTDQNLSVATEEST